MWNVKETLVVSLDEIGIFIILIFIQVPYGHLAIIWLSHDTIVTRDYGFRY